MVDAFSEEGAFNEAIRLGINPGGEVAIFILEDDAIDLKKWEKNTLIPPEALQGEGYKKTGSASQEELQQINPTIICEHCNE